VVKSAARGSARTGLGKERHVGCERVHRETGGPYRSRVGNPAEPIDFIVTTPKNRMNEAAAEAWRAKMDHRDGLGAGYYARSVPFIPRGCRPGSRIFYVENGFIRGFGVAGEIVGRDHPEAEFGPFIKIPCDSWRWIRPIRMRGFRGIRQFAKAVEVIGVWRDPRPTDPDLEARIAALRK